MFRFIKRGLRKVLTLVFVLAFLTPLGYWLSEEDDLVAPSRRREKDYNPKLSHFRSNIDRLDANFLDDDPISDDLYNEMNERETKEKATVHPDQPAVVEVRNSMVVQLGDFPLKESMVNVIGGQRTTPPYLIIGIPTILRQSSGVQYLTTTVKSLLENIDPEEELPEVQILVFAADTDPESRQRVISAMTSSFSHQLKTGAIQILSVNSSAYPPLTNLKRNYNDLDDRVTWRAKQVVDFSFMFYYARNRSQYYMQIEDDVISSPHFFAAIKTFVASQNRHWVTLDFSTLGFIGKLVRSSDLEEFARFLMMFYDEQPVDYLYIIFMQILVQDRPILHRPTLFQHFGSHSSLPGKSSMQIYKDKFFALGRDAKLPVFRIIVNSTKNPVAEILTSIEGYSKFGPSAPYGEIPGYFWGKTPKAEDVFLIIFQEKQKLKSVFFQTGRETQQNDYLHHGVLEISPPRDVPDRGNALEDINEVMKAECGEFTKIDDFDKGVVEKENIETNAWTKCVRVRVTEGQEEWIIINDIVIKTHKQAEDAVL